MEEYIVKAYSQSTNETQRQVNLMSAHPSTKDDALRWANSFANKLNETTNVKDWVGQIELINPTAYIRTH